VTNTPSMSCFAELGSFPHWIEGTAGVRVDDFNTVVGGISRRRRIAARGRVRRIERGRAEGEAWHFWDWAAWARRLRHGGEGRPSQQPTGRR
jgi:hypothetical protein